jgi:hypothetical protein
MRKHYSRLLLLALYFLIGYSSSNAQVYFGITYQASTFAKGLPNFKNEVYTWNHIKYPNFEDKFEFSNFFHGMGFELGGFTDNKMHVFTGWENKHFTTHGSGNYTDLGRSYEGDITVKVRHNIFHTVGLGYQFSKGFTLGASALDIGTFKVLKMDTKAATDADKFVQLYPGNTGLFSQNTTLGMTLYADIYPASFFRLRASYYFDYFRNDLGIDPFRTYQLSSFNVQAAIIIGNKK